MPLDKLEIPPDQAGYSARDFNRVLSVNLDGGVSRTRSDMVGGDSVVNVQWTVGRQGFDDIVTFYQDTINYGADAFLMDLYLDFSEPTEYECHLLPGSLRLQSQRGNRFVVVGELEIKPNEDEDRDNAIVELYGAYESIETIDEVFGEFDNLFFELSSSNTPNTGDPEFDAAKAELVEEYCSEEILDETLQSLEDLVGDFFYVDNDDEYLAQELIIELGSAQAVKDRLGELEELVNFGLAPETTQEPAEPTLEELKAPLIEEYCSEEVLCETLQSLEDLVVNLEIPEQPYDRDEEIAGQEVIAEYGDVQVADDVLEYLEFLVNREIPNLEVSGPKSIPNPEAIAAYDTFEEAQETFQELEDLANGGLAP